MAVFGLTGSNKNISKGQIRIFLIVLLGRKLILKKLCRGSYFEYDSHTGATSSKAPEVGAIYKKWSAVGATLNHDLCTGAISNKNAKKGAFYEK